MFTLVHIESCRHIVLIFSKLADWTIFLDVGVRNAQFRPELMHRWFVGIEVEILKNINAKKEHDIWNFFAKFSQ